MYIVSNEHSHIECLAPDFADTLRERFMVATKIHSPCYFYHMEPATLGNHDALSTFLRHLTLEFLSKFSHCLQYPVKVDVKLRYGFDIFISKMSIQPPVWDIPQDGIGIQELVVHLVRSFFTCNNSRSNNQNITS